MATVTAFDNINKLGSAKDRPTYAEYYEPMDISPAQKRKRAVLADAIEDAVLFLFMLYIVAKQHDKSIEKSRALQEYREKLKEALEGAGLKDDVVQAYMADVVPEEVRVTAERYLDDDYWTSYDRAITIAQDDSNTLWNGTEYQEAVEAGKTMKQWLTMKDYRVRETHRAVDDETIPIDEPFVVGDSLMMYPRDATTFGASLNEIAGCRCSCSYS